MRRLIHRVMPARGWLDHPVLALLFVLVCAPVLVVLALAVPTGEVPDEVAHIIRADSVRHGRLLGVRASKLDFQGVRVDDAGVRADPSLIPAGFALVPGTPIAQKAMTRARLEALYDLPWANRLEIISVTNTAVYPPTLYVPAALGMHVAKLAGAGPFTSILCARLVNAALFLSMGTAALLLARRGRTVLLAGLCLPMTLWLAASVNQDGLVIACGGLAAALLTRGTLRSWWLAVPLFAVAAMAKPYLLPLVVVVLASMPGGLRREWRRACAGLAVAALPAVLWSAGMAAFLATPFVRGPAKAAGPLFAGPAGTLFNTTNPGEQLRILLADPSRLVSLPLESLWAGGEWLWRETIGVLGTLDVVLPFALYDLWTWALAAAVLAGFLPSRQAGRGILPALVAAAGFVAAAWMAYVLQYLSWTEVGNALIEGFQGRYLIPAAIIALPVAALPEAAWGGRPGIAQGVLRALLTVPVALLAAANVVILPAIVLWSYYVR